MENDEFYENFSKRFDKSQRIERAKERYFEELSHAQKKVSDVEERFSNVMDLVHGIDERIAVVLGCIDEREYEEARGCWGTVSIYWGEAEYLKDVRTSVAEFKEIAEDAIKAKERICRASYEKNLHELKLAEDEDIINLKRMLTQVVNGYNEAVNKIAHYEESEDIGRYWRED